MNSYILIINFIGLLKLLVTRQISTATIAFGCFISSTTIILTEHYVVESLDNAIEQNLTIKQFYYKNFTNEYKLKYFKVLDKD